MLSVKRAKDNIRLAFIEKLFINREIGTNVQTSYLNFKGMSYESESYLCDISCVQLRKALAQFQCGNMQREVMLGAWKGMPYTKRLCRGCDLGKVENEKYLLLVYPNTQKVRKRFCLALPFTHTSTLIRLMQTMNTVTLTKFVAWCQYQKTIYFPWSTFRLLDFLVPDGCKIINNKQIYMITMFFTIDQYYFIYFESMVSSGLAIHVMV
jgi:hypothetical protein